MEIDLQKEWNCLNENSSLKEIQEYAKKNDYGKRI